MSAYDVVVVGAGAAGCVVAARLAEAGRSVLLLEAGPDLRAEVPPDFRDGWAFPRRHEWGLEAVPDGRGNAVPLRRGRLVGGTGWVTRFGVRCTPSDFEQWVALGCDGWDFDTVLPWFRALESDLEFPDAAWHGADGPVPVTRYPEHPPSELAMATIAACAALGIPAVDDHNRPGATGAGRMPMTGRGGARVTTADAYLPVGGTPDTLTIRPETLVARVDLHQGRAVGVHLADGERVESKHVVVCAGVYGSPALLMRSGIGPADRLDDVAVPTVVDLPGVGANLADHPAVWLPTGHRPAEDGRPPLHTLATFRSSRCPAADPPDLAFWVADPQDGDEAEIEVVLMTPRSRGWVRLRSADPADLPLVRLPDLDEPDDVDRFAEGLERARDLAGQSALLSIGEGAALPELATVDDRRAWIAAERYSLPHTVGTCAMGSGPDAVVDPSGRVRGVDRLHVVDASVIPLPPSGFPHLVTIMLAERLAAQLAADG